MNVEPITIRFDYADSCDLLDALEELSAELAKFGVDMQILEGGESYEEVRLSKVQRTEPCAKS